MRRKQPWSRNDKLGATAVFVAVITCASAFFIPEVRRFFGLEKPIAAQEPTTVAQPKVPANQPLEPTAVPTQSVLTIKTKKAPDSTIRKIERPPAQNCPNGICIGGDNNGTATVNNFGIEPKVVWTLFESHGQWQDKHPTTSVLISVDRMLENAKFAIVCDRPCSGVYAEMKGVTSRQWKWGKLPGSPNIAAFIIDAPNPLPSGIESNCSVESEDDSPVRIVDVQKLTITDKSQ